MTHVNGLEIDLSGITLLHSPDTHGYGPAITEFEPGSQTVERINTFTRAQAHIMNLARKNGANVFCADEGDERPNGPGVYWQDRTYFAAQAVTQHVVDTYCSHIPAIPRYSLVRPDETQQAYASLKGGQPLVLAYTVQDRGHMKYLIRRPEQLERFQNFAADIGGEAPLDITKFELRQFVATPSRHFSSMRLVVDATGALLAAAIDYSLHTKDQPLPVIAHDRLLDSRPNSLPRTIKNALEDPDSPYFLEAEDVRSNSPHGSRIVPLMGEYRKPLNTSDYEVLESYCVDPEDPSPPPQLIAAARFIGRAVAPHVHLMVGLDFVGPHYLCEVNFSPGAAAFAACHMGGGGTDFERYVAMREQALVNLGQIPAAERTFELPLQAPRPCPPSSV